jgi:hypothetical protein
MRSAPILPIRQGPEIPKIKLAGQEIGVHRGQGIDAL